ncbi:MAG: hypothetical protein JST54_04495 [Deltaproteobacteria bacterium]|nr:hypothetical protein [Deltaproteobacteria bacterium]
MIDLLATPPPRFAVKLMLAFRRALHGLADRIVPAQLVIVERAMGTGATQTLALVAEHRIADLLHSGPRSGAELAQSTGLDRDGLERTLRALATLGIFERLADGRWGNTRLSEVLRSDGPLSVRAYAAYMGSPSTAGAWASFAETVRTGKSAFPRVFGKSVWTYFDEHPDERDLFAEVMTQLTLSMAPSVAAAYPWHEVRRVCDVGGGRGHLLSALLRAHPALQGALLDGPGVIDLARDYLRGQGMLERVQLWPGSFFDDVPAGCDAYLLKDVLHDWDDARSLRILRNVRKAMQPGNRVLVTEMLVEPDTTDGPGPFVDLQMLTVCDEGRQRSRAEMRALLDRAGFELTRVVHTPVLVSVVEGVAR